MPLMSGANAKGEQVSPAGGGQMASLIRAHDWGATPLGPMDAWPCNLKVAVDLALAGAIPMVVLWGPELRQIYNDAYRDLLGDKHPAALGQPHAECWRDVSHVFAPIHQRVLAGEGVSVGDLRLPGVNRHGSPEDAWVTAAYTPLRGGSGAVEGAFVTVFETTPGVAAAATRDITRRKQAEEALRQSEAKYGRLFDSMKEAFFVADVVVDESGTPVDYRFLEANPALERVTGLRSEKLIGRLVSDAVPGVDPRWIDVFGAVALTGEPGHLELHSTNLDRWFEAHGYSPLPGQVAVLFLDITDRKRAENALADAVQRLNAHMDNSPLAIVEFDREFRVIRWSKEAERLFGWAADEVLGRGMAQLQWVYESDIEMVRQVSQDMLEGRRPRNLSVNRNYRRDGSIIECEWYNSAIYDANGELASILSQVLDITERKRAEERLRQAQKLESIGLLAGGIAHDFNNLLTGIMGNASIVQDEVPLASAERIRAIVAAAERAAHLTRQLLAYAGKGQFVVRDLDVSEAVQEIATLVEFSIPKSVDFSVSVQRRLPLVRMDPGQLQQILMNLVINAGEAIGEGAPGSIAVTTSMADVPEPFPDAVGIELAAGRYVCIEVRDTGPGIEEDKKPKIFDPFFTTKFTGRGLGLAAVAGILRSEKGGITLETARGRGSTFRVFLPASRHTAPGEEPRGEGRGTILVVDDEASVRRFLDAALRRQGYRVLSAADGREALAVYDRENGAVDVIVLDIVMPVMSAGDLLPRLKERQLSAGILLTSGYSESEARRLCSAYPDASFIQKPYTAEQLVEAVAQLMQAERRQ
jgi:two-component system, cell cycle sensor histidine kinase and response regulator CckA